MYILHNWLKRPLHYTIDMLGLGDIVNISVYGDLYDMSFVIQMAIFDVYL